MSELKDMLSGDETEQEDLEEDAPKPEAKEAEETEEAQETEAEAEESQAETEPEEKPKKPREQKSVPLAAFLETQRKLQEKLDAAEKRAAELDARTKAQPDYSSFFKKPPEQIPSVYDDEQGFTAASRQHLQSETYNNRFGMSLDYAVQSFGQQKVNEALSAFQQAAQSNPMLSQAAEASYNPVREIVQWHDTQTQLRKLEAVGGLDAYEKNLRAQIEKELSEKYAKQAEAADDDDDDAPPQKTKPTLPSNFNKGGKGGNNSYSGPPDLKSLLG